MAPSADPPNKPASKRKKLLNSIKRPFSSSFSTAGPYGFDLNDGGQSSIRETQSTVPTSSQVDKKVENTRPQSEANAFAKAKLGGFTGPLVTTHRPTVDEEIALNRHKLSMIGSKHVAGLEDYSSSNLGSNASHGSKSEQVDPSTTNKIASPSRKPINKYLQPLEYQLPTSQRPLNEIDENSMSGATSGPLSKPNTASMAKRKPINQYMQPLQYTTYPLRARIIDPDTHSSPDVIDESSAKLEAVITQKRKPMNQYLLPLEYSIYPLQEPVGSLDGDFVSNTEPTTMSASDADRATLSTQPNVQELSPLARVLAYEGRTQPPADLDFLLHEAVDRWNLSQARYFITAGADVNCVSGDRRETILIKAAKRDYERLISDLLIPLLEANNNSGSSHSKLQTPDLKISDIDGWTPLDWAVANQHVNATRYLVKRVKDLNVADPDEGWTVLHRACVRQSSEIVRLLVDHGANVFSCDNAGQTPLHRAAGKGNLNTVALLVEAGADVNARDRQNNSPLDRALLGRHSAVMTYLSERSRSKQAQNRDTARDKEKLREMERSRGKEEYKKELERIKREYAETKKLEEQRRQKEWLENEKKWSKSEDLEKQRLEKERAEIERARLERESKERDRLTKEKADVEQLSEAFRAGKGKEREKPYQQDPWYEASGSYPDYVVKDRNGDMKQKTASDPSYWN